MKKLFISAIMIITLIAIPFTAMAGNTADVNLHAQNPSFETSSGTSGFGNDGAAVTAAKHGEADAYGFINGWDKSIAWTNAQDYGSTSTSMAGAKSFARYKSLPWIQAVGLKNK